MREWHTLAYGTFVLPGETPKHHIRRLTISVAVTPWYRPFLMRKRQQVLRKVISIYKGRQ